MPGLFACSTDGSVIRLGDHFDLFGVSDKGHLVFDREKADSSYATLDAVLHENDHETDQWYVGQLYPYTVLESHGGRTPSLCQIEPLTEITPSDAVKWLFANFGHLPAKATAALGKPEAPADAPPPKPHEGDAIDFAAVASDLRKARKPMQATLVDFMAATSQATAEDVAENVHKDSATSERVMRNNADRTNASLEDMGVPVRFRLASGRMFREILPE